MTALSVDAAKASALDDSAAIFSSTHSFNSVGSSGGMALEYARHSALSMMNMLEWTCI